MKKFNALFFLIVAALTFTQLAQAQGPYFYLNEVFDEVSVTRDVTYGTNLTIITGTPAPQELKMDVYEPAGDESTDRPVVVYFHTGSFLPQYFNGQITGGKQDSAAVEVCTRLAKMGYVAISATYRAGWLPLAEDQNVRTRSLLQAAYRGIQDARTLVRFLRRSINEGGNEFGIDTDKIVLWGQGTGGYISLGCGFLDSFEEIALEKFIDTNTAEIYIDTTVHGNIYGTNQAVLNMPNWPEYSSDFAMAVNMGGALGDSSWIDGHANEPATIGYHVVSDPFAPFDAGPVIVPTTQEFVVSVSGTRHVLVKVNETSVNDVMDPVFDTGNPVNASTLALNAKVEFLKNVTVNLSALGQGTAVRLGEDHLYPFIVNGLGSGPWDWWNKPLLDAIIAQINTQLPAEGQLNSNQLHTNGLITNPDMSAEKARAYMDTIINYYAPRAFHALGLPLKMPVDVQEAVLQDAQVNLQLSPNPAGEFIELQTNFGAPIKDVLLFDLNGRMVQSEFGIENSNYQVRRQNLPSGTYILKLRFEEGVLTKKVVFR